MNPHSKSMFHILALFGLLASLLGSAVFVTPAYAAGIVVNTDTDKDGLFIFDGQCGLREAIANATNDAATFPDCSAGSGADTITFAANYTITLRNELAVTTAITITGNGAANTIIQANAAPNTATYRVLEVTGIGNLTLDSLTIRNGYCGGLCATSATSGGGIYNNAGTLTVSNVTFSGNSALYGGGVNNFNSSPALTNVTFSANTATYSGGGMYNYVSSPTLTNVTFSGNSATYSGGGMYNSFSSNSTLTGVTFSGNSASGGGGMYNINSSPALTNVTFSGNSAGGDGGGMYNDFSRPILTNVTFSANSATSIGGGMYNANSSPTLMNVTFSGNSAGAGGGMYNNISSPTLTNVSFGNNSSARGGGGMFNFSSSPTLTNLTFSGNSAGGDGGGMFNINSSPTLTNVTFSANSAGSGGGMFNFTSSSPTLTNTLIANSASGGDCVNNLSTLNAASSNNLIEDSLNACGLTDSANGNIIGQDPNLGVLANNGGITQTHALLAGSPAIDTGTNTGCPATDQRDVTRPQGAACDVGAYEVEVDCTPPTDTPTNTPTATPTNTPTPTPAGFGCTPGFWKNHISLWPAPYLPTDKVVVVFSAASTYPNSIQNATLLQALRFTGGTNINGAAKNLLRAGVAALLNAQSGFGYPLTTQEVIDDVNEALATHNRATMLALAKTLDGYNNALCPLPISG